MIDKKGNSLKIWWSGTAFVMRSHMSTEACWEEYFFKGSNVCKGPVAGKVSAPMKLEWWAGADYAGLEGYRGFPGGTSGKELDSQCRRLRAMGLIPGPEDPLEESIATHSSILAWGIPRTEESGGL